MSTTNDEVAQLFDNFSRPGQRCPECGKVGVAGERQRRIVHLEGTRHSLGVKIHALYSICAPCGEKPRLRIIEEFDRVLEHMVSAAAYGLMLVKNPDVVQ